MHCQKQTQFNVTINQNQEIHKLLEALLDGSNQIIGIKSSWKHKISDQKDMKYSYRF